MRQRKTASASFASPVRQVDHQRLETRVTVLELTIAERLNSVSVETKGLRESLDVRLTTMEKSTDGRLTTMERNTDVRFASVEKAISDLRETFDVRFIAMETRMDVMQKSMDAGFDRLSDKITGMNALLTQRIDQCATKLQVFLWGFIMLSALASGAMGLASAIYRQHGETFTPDVIDTFRGK
ncbi:hypothetical protein L2Y96_11955 [Luteibacter aegosomaticola]|uniref:hypothetical protein n=1 Tax=Luteibacter aegosomaticola TaxID=2911538 RepID=UPI001FFADE69|nr:hypothetical protein [Luteibacter aegosomaticola]UPG88132.1 hypothetical protein L2Y96_11955 [Luteibacter aegosomaticola]